MKAITAKERSGRIRKGVFKYLSVKVLVISALFLVSLYGFILIVHEAVLKDEQTFDDKVFDFFAAHSSPRFIQVMRYFTFFGSHTFLIPAYLVVISFYLFRKKYRSALHITIIGISSTLLMFGLKEVFARSRPDLPLVESLTNNYGFPSGHALSSFIFFGMFIYIIWHSTRMPGIYKWISIPLVFAFTLTVAMSRVVLRVHYPTDVIASYCLGNLWTVLSLEVMRKISRKRQLNVAPHAG
ncbi:MAG: phosphatase family protein [Flavipsychrobacter sp.]|jgi:undecaprenyl-diphosphatase|nr:phosphatase family protein [Flavipsychrobacter sp.]